MQESKSCALPLGDSPKIVPLRNAETHVIKQGCPVGLEPTVSRATIWRVNQLRYGHRSSVYYRKRVMGIEPTYTAWKAVILPLNYTRKATPLVCIMKGIGVTGFEPATPWSQTRCSTKLSHTPVLHGFKRTATPHVRKDAKGIITKECAFVKQYSSRESLYLRSF